MAPGTPAWNGTSTTVSRGLRLRLGERGAVAEGEYVFQLAFRPPYDWRLLLSFLAPRVIPGVETITNGVYRRTLAIQGHRGLLEVRPASSGANALRVHIRFPQPECLLQIVTRARAMFDLAADPEVVRRVLGTDPMLAPLLGRHAGSRLPGVWNSLEPVVHAVLRQRFSLEETQILQAQLAEECGEPMSSLGAGELHYTFPSAPMLADSRLTFLPRSTADAVRAAAQAVAGIRSNAPPDELLVRLRAIKVVDDSAIQYVAMRALNDSDALPVESPELRGGLQGISDSRALIQRAERWKPWRAYAAMLIMGAGSHSRSATGKRERAVVGQPAV